MRERPFIDRVDDGILAQVHHLHQLRGITLRAALEDFRQSAVENVELSAGTEDYDIWLTRVDRCNLMLSNPDDLALRRRVAEAREHDR